MEGGNTTVRLNVALAVSQRPVPFEFRLKPEIRDLHTLSVGAAEGCDLLILKNQNSKIAAFGSSYAGSRVNL